MSADIFYKEAKNRELRKQLLRKQLNSLKLEIKRIELKCNKDLNQPSSSSNIVSKSQINKDTSKTKLASPSGKEVTSIGKTHLQSSLSSNIQQSVNNISSNNVNKATITTTRKQLLPGKVGLIAQMEAMRKQSSSK